LSAEPTQAPVAVILEVRAASGRMDDLISWCEENLADTRARAGCYSCELYTHPEDADAAVILEYWRSREHHQAYGAWRAENGSSAEFGALLAGPASVRYLAFRAT
jgi:quinol monooxygenase YgiN